MLETIFQSAASTLSNPLDFLICSGASLLFGLLIAVSYMYRSRYTASFVVTLALLPIVVQVVIAFVNGSLGTGIAVAGAFSLVRFRSIAGSAREIGSVFIAMAVGLGTGMGYIGVSAVFTVIICAVLLLYTILRFGEPRAIDKQLKITISESLDYNGIFDDLFQTYTRKAELISVRTTNLGSLYQLQYNIILKDPAKEKEFIDELRCRNGNLDIICGRASMGMLEQL